MSQAAAGIVVTCGSCGSRLRVRAEADGKIGKCPKCGARFQIVLPAPPKNQQAASPPAAEASVPQSPPPAQAAQVATPEPPAQPTAVAAAPAAPESCEVLSENDWQRGMSPEVLREVAAEEARLARQGSISVAVLVFASLVAGAAVCFHVARYGGAEHWVVKRSVAAWLLGMMTAGAMLASSARRGGALRFLAAVTAAAAVVLGKLLASPAAAYVSIDVLFAVLAIAGSTFTFILAEPSGKPAPPEADAATQPA